MRRIQIHIDESLDDAVAAAAARKGVSKAALIRSCVASALRHEAVDDQDPWNALVGWLDDEPVTDIDEAVYGPKR
jgi:hypothetical protein